MTSCSCDLRNYKHTDRHTHTHTRNMVSNIIDLLHHDVERANTTCMSSPHSTIYTMCVATMVNKRCFLCGAASVLYIATFCCSLWTNCREMGSHSACASSHRKLVDKAVCLSVGRHGRCVSDAIIIFHIVLTNW